MLLRLRQIICWFCIVSAFMIAALLGLPRLVYAQEQASEIRIAQMNIAVWPEYDDPRVLVIYQLKVAEPVEYPFRISFLIPKDADVGMGCEVAESGGHGCRPYRVEDRGEFNELSFEVSSQPTIFMEYYYQPLKRDSNKSFDFFYKPLYPVDNLYIEVQRPLKATEFNTEPVATETYTDNKRFKYHVLKLGSAEKDQPVKVKVSYKKSNPQPSVSRQTDEEARQQSNSQPNVNNIATVFLAVTVVVFGSVIGYQFFAIRRRREKLTKEDHSEQDS